MSFALRHTNGPGWFPAGFTIYTPATLPGGMSAASLIGPVPLLKLVEWWWKPRGFVPAGSIVIPDFSATKTSPTQTQVNTVTGNTCSVVPGNYNGYNNAFALTTPAQRVIASASHTLNAGLAPSGFGGGVLNVELFADGPSIYCDSSGDYYVALNISVSTSAKYKTVLTNYPAGGGAPTVVTDDGQIMAVYLESTTLSGAAPINFDGVTIQAGLSLQSFPSDSNPDGEAPAVTASLTFTREDY
jgi:hypothetical protein